MSNGPRVSVVTVNFNSGNMLLETVESVARQVEQSFEYLVIDGNSSDDSFRKIASHSRINLKLSEPDKGISDAFNKGILLARGEWIHFLNAGDTYVAEDSLAMVAPYLKQDIALSAQVIYRNKSFPDPSVPKSGSLRKRAMIHHQATFIPRSWFDEFDLYNLDFKIRMDFEFWLRTLKTKKVEFLEKVIVNFHAGKSFDEIDLYYQEELKAIRMHLPSWPLHCLNSALRWKARKLLRRMGMDV